MQAADLVIENPLDKNQVKIKCLFDQGTKTETIKHALNLKPISKEKTLLNAFSSKKFDTTELDKKCINLKMSSNENFSMVLLCKPFICLPNTNQPVKYAKNNSDFLKDLNLAHSGTMEETDMLIDTDFYLPFVTGKVKMSKTGEPVPIETKFSSVLNGPSNENASQCHVTAGNERETHVLNLCFGPTKISDPLKLKIMGSRNTRHYKRKPLCMTILSNLFT